MPACGAYHLTLHHFAPTIDGTVYSQYAFYVSAGSNQPGVDFTAVVLACWQEAAARRASMEKDVRAELKLLKRLRDAGVESWKEVLLIVENRYVSQISLPKADDAYIQY